jgi:mono/diheme cytochrome c family protein
MKRGLEVVKREGARIFVGLAAMPRGDAKRLADAMPELHVLVLGKPIEGGDGNDGLKAPELAGSTLIVESSNHLQTVGVVDLFVRDPENAPLVFADAGGVAKAGDLLGVSKRIHDLEIRIDSWERDKTVDAADLEARRADLKRLRDEKAKLEVADPPQKGSFFLYRSVEVRADLGSSIAVSKDLEAYYKRLNEHNKLAFADRKAAPPEKGKARYLGVDACSSCHEEERSVWDVTPHSRAYASLKTGFKEYNLDCVGCHVTGYGKAGGSTVTDNDKLRDVGCEECHGPGSLHADAPQKKGLIEAKPNLAMCAASCHHPPHVEGFDANVKVENILGKGHGR